MKKLMFFNLFLMVFGWVSLGLSFELWDGETTRNVKLREAPGLDQRVLTVIARGDKAEVLDQKEDWYLVSIKGKQSEIKGWVFAKFIKLVAGKAEAARRKAPLPLGNRQRRNKKQPRFLRTKRLQQPMQG